MSYPCSGQNDLKQDEQVKGMILPAMSLVTGAHVIGALFQGPPPHFWGAPITPPIKAKCRFPMPCSCAPVVALPLWRPLHDILKKHPLNPGLLHLHCPKNSTQLPPTHARTLVKRNGCPKIGYWSLAEPCPVYYRPVPLWLTHLFTLPPTLHYSLLCPLHPHHLNICPAFAPSELVY